MKCQSENRKKRYAKDKLIAMGYNAADITPQMIEDSIKNLRPKGRTRPAGYEDASYCYYFLEDGECTLENPIVFKRLINYVYKTIRFTNWIYKKNFIEPEEVLTEVMIELKGVPSFKYGDEHTDAITFLIRKINTQIGREWWKYLKTFDPKKYESLIQQQKDCTSKKEPTELQAKKKAELSKRTQKKNIDQIAPLYVLSCVRQDLKYQTGAVFTAKEIRSLYPHLLEQKAKDLSNKRYLKQLRAMQNNIDSAIKEITA